MEIFNYSKLQRQALDAARRAGWQDGFIVGVVFASVLATCIVLYLAGQP